MLRYYVYGSYCMFKGINKKGFIVNMITKNALLIKDYRPTPFYNESNVHLHQLHAVWGNKTPFIKSLVVRGIGYRLLLIENRDKSHTEVFKTTEIFLLGTLSHYSQDDLKSYGDTVIAKSPITNKPYTKWKSFYDEYYNIKGDSDFLDDYRAFHDLQASKFLIVRVGHTTDTIIPLSQFVNIKTHKKDRKITIYGPSKTEVNGLAKTIYQLRKPSPYTGRGVKFKHIRVRYKKVRKTKAGGRAF